MAQQSSQTTTTTTAAAAAAAAAAHAGDSICYDTQVHRERRDRVRASSRSGNGLEPLGSKARRSLRELIFRRYDGINYGDETGLTHFHIACEAGCDDIARKFLDRGQCPDLLWPETGDAALHLALEHGAKKVALLLLKRGADPNLANWEGATPLHVICTRKRVDAAKNAELAAKFLKLSKKRKRPANVNARDAAGNTPLHYAVAFDQVALVELLLKKGANANLANAQGMTVLHVVSAKQRDPDFIEKLLKFMSADRTHGLRIDAFDEEGNTPLMWAMLHANPSAAEWLLRHDADPNMPNYDGSTPLHVMCQIHRKDDELPTTFFKVCEELREPLMIDAGENMGNAPLHLAVLHEDKLLVELLLRRGADLNVANDEGSTPLHALSQKNRDKNGLATLIHEIMKEIERPPLEVDQRDKAGDTALHLALRSGNKAAGELLLKLGADPNSLDKTGSTPLHVLCKDHEDDYAWAEMFFKLNDKERHPLRVDAVDDLGNSPLLWAVRKYNKWMAQLLLERGRADPNLANKDGMTPLHVVCRAGCDVDCVEILFDCSHEPVRIDARDKSGDTPLHLAMGFGNEQLITAMLRKDVDPNAVNDAGATPLHNICKKNHGDVVGLQLFFDINREMNRRVEVNVRDKSGDTPLHLAVRQRNVKAAELLLKQGADPNLVNNAGLAPLHVCIKNNDDEMTRMFFEINSELSERLAVNAKDKSGRSLLQLAVANLSPFAVDLLLKHGADMSDFVFPDQSYFARSFQFHMFDSNVRFRLASGALAVLDSLEDAGYEPTRHDALTIMRFFLRHQLFVDSSAYAGLIPIIIVSNDDNDDDYDEAYFASVARRLAINADLSLHDVSQLRPEQVTRRVSYTDCFRLVREKKSSKFYPRSVQRAIAKLFEQVTRGFFRCWAVESFSHLAHNRWPIDICEKIIGNRRLTCQDLCNICEAATL